MVNLDELDKELRLYVGMGEISPEDALEIWNNSISAKNAEQAGSGESRGD